MNTYDRLNKIHERISVFAIVGDEQRLQWTFFPCGQNSRPGLSDEGSINNLIDFARRLRPQKKRPIIVYWGNDRIARDAISLVGQGSVGLRSYFRNPLTIEELYSGHSSPGSDDCDDTSYRDAICSGFAERALSDMGYPNPRHSLALAAGAANLIKMRIFSPSL